MLAMTNKLMKKDNQEQDMIDKKRGYGKPYPFRMVEKRRKI